MNTENKSNSITAIDSELRRLYPEMWADGVEVKAEPLYSWLTDKISHTADSLPGRLEHTDLVDFPQSPDQRLRYRLFVAACLEDIDAQVGIKQADIDSITRRQEAGDVWSWCIITVRVDSPGREDLGHADYTLEGASYWGLHDFFADCAGAMYPLMQTQAMGLFCQKIVKEVIGLEDAILTRLLRDEFGRRGAL